MWGGGGGGGVSVCGGVGVCGVVVEWVCGVGWITNWVAVVSKCLQHGSRLKVAHTLLLFNIGS